MVHHHFFLQVVDKISFLSSPSGVPREQFIALLQPSFHYLDTMCEFAKLIDYRIASSSENI